MFSLARDGVFVCLLPQKEKIPPLDLVAFDTSVTSADGCFSMILHPTGTTSSSIWIFRSLIAVSHAVEPFVARYCENGLFLARGRLLVRRIAVAMLFAVAVFVNCGGGCSIRSGTTACMSESLA